VHHTPASPFNEQTAPFGASPRLCLERRGSASSTLAGGMSSFNVPDVVHSEHFRGLQAEILARWIAAARAHQNRGRLIGKAKEMFGVELSYNSASNLLAEARSRKAGPAAALGPRHGPRRMAGSSHDPAPGS
jgi:hypothetical protein